MTALTRYLRLEALGQWQASAEDPLREVIVSLGDATLTLSDIDGNFLTHWSIGAVTRSESERALFHPDGDPEQTLLLADNETEMIQGIDRLLHSLQAPVAAPVEPSKIWRNAGLGLLGIGLVALAGFAPMLLRTIAVAGLAPPHRHAMTTQMLTALEAQGYALCSTPEAAPALNRLEALAFPDGTRSQLIVLSQADSLSAHLPGPVILIDGARLASLTEPATLVAHLRAEQAALDAGDPLMPLLASAAGGLGTSWHLLTRASLDPEAALAMAKAGLASGVMLAGAPTPNSVAFSDDDWVRLQGICQG